MIATTDDIYAFTDTVTRRCREKGCEDIAQRLDDALQLGSSGLEILGAIKTVLVSETSRLEKLVDRTALQETINFVNRAFGAK